jgi:hypothetical protein
MMNNKKPIMNKEVLSKISIICKAAQRQLTSLGKKNSTLPREEKNKIVAVYLAQLVEKNKMNLIDLLYKEADAAIKATTSKVVVNQDKPGAKTKPGWGNAPHGGGATPNNGNGYIAFQKQYRPILKAANPDKSGKEISSELGACWRKMKLHFPNYVERYKSAIDSNPEDEELANAMNKITLVEQSYTKNLKKRRTNELRPPRHPPKKKVIRKSREFSKLFHNAESMSPAVEPVYSEPVLEGWGADAAQAVKEEEELNLSDFVTSEPAELDVLKPDPEWRKKRRCVPYLESLVKTTTSVPLVSIDHHIKETMAYCKAARVKVYAPCSGYTVSGKLGLLLSKTFFKVVNDPTTKMEVVKCEDNLSSFPRYTISITTPNSTKLVVLSVGTSLPCAQWPTTCRKMHLPRNHIQECRIWKEDTPPCNDRV